MSAVSTTSAWQMAINNNYDCSNAQASALQLQSIVNTRTHTHTHTHTDRNTHKASEECTSVK